MRKKAILISCFHYYENRIRLIEEFLRGRGYDCTYITSDFDHIGKKPFRFNRENAVQIPTKPYQKNFSAARIQSHYRFAKETFLKIEELSPHLIFAEIPPNSLVKQAAEYKKAHPEVRLILDLYDLWPENFPGRGLKKLFALPFRAWRKIRDDGLYAADLVTMECELYRNQLEKQLAGKKTEILYLCRKNATVGAPKAPEIKELGLCYLGSINNVIDISAIEKLIGEIVSRRPVTLHIIGDGETREKLIDAAQTAGAKVEFYGVIYDVAQKQQIFDRCGFGLNMMKSDVCVGLTMKSIDYFAGGLPVLNTIGGDTEQLVERYGAGFNICLDDSKKTAERVAAMTPEENRKMRQNALRMFEELFSEEAFFHSLERIFGEDMPCKEFGADERKSHR